jgi:hypothetical protein
MNANDTNGKRHLWHFCAFVANLCIAGPLLAVTTQPALTGAVASTAPPSPPVTPYVQQAIKDLDLTPQLLSGVRTGAGGGSDPLKDMTEHMTVIRDDLGEWHTDMPVQDKEKKVVSELDQLIASLESHTGTGKGNKPNSGRRQSIIVTADPVNGDLHGVDQQGRQWGQLPPKQREEILQSRTEGFPPGYESLLQNYYQQLAQEKPADDKTAAAPTTAP